MPTTPRPILTVQTASLWASGDDSTFDGTGGPAAFDPFFESFSDYVTSAGLAAEPFNDTVRNVDAGDQVTFVIAVQNFGSAFAYNAVIRDLMPVGFAYTAGDLRVTDGLGNALTFSGNLFDPAGGLSIQQPIGIFSNTSGANVALITFTLDATAAVAVPAANITNTAQIVSYAASSGGANVAGSSQTATTASTPVVTTGITVTNVADQASTQLNAGQTASFDITVRLPEGSVQNLQISELLPQIGSSYLQLLGVQIVSFGAHLSASLPVALQPNGTLQLGTVVNTPDNLDTSDDTITLRLTVKGAGTTAGQGTINTVVSATDPNSANGTWSTTISNTLTLGTPDTPPTLSGLSPNQNTTSSTPVLPFSTLVVTDPDVGQVQTMTVHASNPALGTLTGGAFSTNAAGDLVISGSVAAVQAAARALVFTPGAAATGVETVGITVDDGVGGVATNTSTTIAVTAPTSPSALAQYPISPQTVLTSTATGTSTYAQTQSYNGPVDNIQNQFLYDGTNPLAIVALQNNLLVSSRATATAVQVQGGSNVLDMQHGSSFLTSGTGTDLFLLHADQAQTTWNTIINFHPGDSVTIYGYNPSVSTKSWDSSAGAAGYTGATLRIDVDGDGTTDSSLTFSGKSLADTSRYTVLTGNVAGQNYLSIVAA